VGHFETILEAQACCDEKLSENIEYFLENSLNSFLYGDSKESMVNTIKGLMGK